MKFTYLFVAIIFGLSLVSPQRSLASEAPEDHNALAEKRIEKTLATDPDAKSFTGLLKVLSTDADALAVAASQDIPTLKLLSKKRGFHGLIILSMAQKMAAGQLSIEDQVIIAVHTMANISDADHLMGGETPFILYWQFFNNWQIFNQIIPSISEPISHSRVSLVVFSKIEKKDLDILVKSDSFKSLTPGSRGALLHRAHAMKIIDLTSPEWQPILVELLADPTGAGGYEYFLFSQDRGDDFGKELSKFLVKFEENRPILMSTILATSQDLKRLDILSLPLKEKTKETILKLLNGKNLKR